MNIGKIGLGAIVVAAGLVIAALAQEEGGGRGGGGAGARGGRGSDGNRVFLGLGQKPNLEQALRGQPLYEAHCASCHGVDARSGKGPTLLYSNLVMTDVAGSNLIAIIRGGKGAMKGLPALTPAQAADISMYLDQLFEDVANRGTYDYAPRAFLLTGNAPAGKAYFDGNCASCHKAEDFRSAGLGKRAPQEIQQAWLAPRGPAPVVSVTVGSNAPVVGSLVRKSDFEITVTPAGGQSRTIALDNDSKVQTVEDKMLEHDRIVDRITNADMHNVTAYLETLK